MPNARPADEGQAARVELKVSEPGDERRAKGAHGVWPLLVNGVCCRAAPVCVQAIVVATFPATRRRPDYLASICMHMRGSSRMGAIRRFASTLASRFMTVDRGMRRSRRMETSGSPSGGERVVFGGAGGVLRRGALR